jgi:hypothetical protein
MACARRMARARATPDGSRGPEAASLSAAAAPPARRALRPPSVAVRPRASTAHASTGVASAGQVRCGGGIPARANPVCIIACGPSFPQQAVLSYPPGPATHPCRATRFIAAALTTAGALPHQPLHTASTACPCCHAPSPSCVPLLGQATRAHRAAHPPARRPTATPQLASTWRGSPTGPRSGCGWM